MDDGELDYSNQELFLSPNMDDLPSSCSYGFLDELLKDTPHACTHTHTCNPPGPDNPHTHVCFHAHTKLLSSSEDKVESEDTAESIEKKSKKRPLGNREAVRKYREKKKAKAASLEDEVKRLRALNQQLLKRLQGQAALEAEVARLKCLLVDIRGRIEGEIGSFPYQKSANNVNLTNFPGSLVMNPCNIRCDDQVYCQHPGLEGKGGEGEALKGQGFNSCEFENLQCMEYQNSGMRDLPGCSIGNEEMNGNSSSANKRKGGACEATNLNLLLAMTETGTARDGGVHLSKFNIVSYLGTSLQQGKRGFCVK
ncbi:hypothetical protein POTOM_034907 [Populus tomentosa]|uniref:BZIP domain-containing protein n=1 Tax=Populus tomentosa TaxID=118781 RepID=A0A8X7YXY5_POPTO|nr:hypothetical protein POTOM_034907 [Populus tomentosa]